MSEATRDAIQAAITAHLLDEGQNDGIISDWIVLAAWVPMGDPDGTSYPYICSLMPHHHFVGLLDQNLWSCKNHFAAENES